MIKAEQCQSLNYFLLLQLAAGCSFANSLCDGCEFNFSNTLEQSNYDLESWQAFKYGLRIFLMISLTVELKKKSLPTKEGSSFNVLNLRKNEKMHSQKCLLKPIKICFPRGNNWYSIMCSFPLYSRFLLVAAPNFSMALLKLSRVGSD